MKKLVFVLFMLLLISGCLNYTDDDQLMLEYYFGEYGQLYEYGNQRMLDIFVTSDIEGFIPRNKVDVFTSDTPEITLWFFYDNFDKNEEVNIIWKYLETNELIANIDVNLAKELDNEILDKKRFISSFTDVPPIPDNVDYADFGRFKTALSKPKNGWPKGKYEVTFKSEKLEKSVNFLVGDKFKLGALPFDFSIPLQVDGQSRRASRAFAPGIGSDGEILDYDLQISEFEKCFFTKYTCDKAPAFFDYYAFTLTGEETGRGFDVLWLGGYNKDGVDYANIKINNCPLTIKENEQITFTTGFVININELEVSDFDSYANIEFKAESWSNLCNYSTIKNDYIDMMSIDDTYDYLGAMNYRVDNGKNIPETRLYLGCGEIDVKVNSIDFNNKITNVDYMGQNYDVRVDTEPIDKIVPYFTGSRYSYDLGEYYNPVDYISRFDLLFVDKNFVTIRLECYANKLAIDKSDVDIVDENKVYEIYHYDVKKFTFDNVSLEFLALMDGAMGSNGPQKYTNGQENGAKISWDSGDHEFFAYDDGKTINYSHYTYIGGEKVILGNLFFTPVSIDPSKITFKIKYEKNKLPVKEEKIIDPNHVENLYDNYYYYGISQNEKNKINYCGYEGVTSLGSKQGAYDISGTDFVLFFTKDGEDRGYTAFLGKPLIIGGLKIMITGITGSEAFFTMDCDESIILNETPSKEALSPYECTSVVDNNYLYIGDCWCYEGQWYFGKDNHDSTNICEFSESLFKPTVVDDSIYEMRDGQTREFKSDLGNFKLKLKIGAHFSNGEWIGAAFSLIETDLIYNVYIDETPNALNGLTVIPVEINDDFVRFKLNGFPTVIEPIVEPVVEPPIVLDNSNAVLMYGMNELYGNLKDSSGNNINGVVSGITYGLSGKIDKAIGFDGKNDYVSLPIGLVGNNPYSVEAWIYPKGENSWEGAFGTEQTIVTLQNDLNFYLGWSEQDSSHPSTAYIFFNSVRGSSGTYVYAPNNLVPINRWTHIVVLFTGSKYQIYINGNLVKEQIGKYGYKPGGTTYSRIGKDLNLATSRMNFKGNIDELNIYNRILSVDEIKNRYQRGVKK